MEYNLDYFESVLKDWNIELSEKQKKQFITYYEMLIEKNKVMNLTSITEFDDVIEKHFLDSISLHTVTDLSKKKKVIDLGTGAGFPGIPLKIVFPKLDIVLADSLNKRLVFLNEVIEELGLHNIETVHSRAEELAKNKLHREKYDLCVSRAVANLSTLCEYCLPFVKIGGTFIPYKSGSVQDEITEAKKAVSVLGGHVESNHEFVFGKQNLGRTFIIVEKVKKTPKAYPRKAGTPLKQPIK